MGNIIEIISMSVLIVFWFYIFYQMFRNEEVYKIVTKWVDNKKYDRCEKYSYDYMMKPNRCNWYGLKWPNEKDYE